VRKIAVELQSGLSMIALTMPVTYAWPRLMRAVGWSLISKDGTIQETAGSEPARAAETNAWNGRMSRSW